MPLTKDQRLTRAGFTKTKPKIDDYLDHLGTDISKIQFNHKHEDDKSKVTVHSQSEDIGAGGETVKEALEWLIVARYEKEHPIDVE